MIKRPAEIRIKQDRSWREGDSAVDFPRAWQIYRLSLSFSPDDLDNRRGLKGRRATFRYVVGARQASRFLGGGSVSTPR